MPRSCGTYHLPARWYDCKWWESQKILDKDEPPIQSFIGDHRGAAVLQTMQQSCIG